MSGGEGKRKRGCIYFDTPACYPRIMFGLGSTELFIILVIVLVLFGGNKLPSLGSALGKGIRNFRKSFSGQDEEETKKNDSNS